MADYTPNQLKIIDRYYQNFDSIKSQRLSEIIAEIYLSEGKKRDRLWKQTQDLLTALKVPESRITHLMEKRDPALLVKLLEEVQAQGK